MKHKKQLLVKYFFIDYEQVERQKKLDDAFDVIFDKVDIADSKRINNKNEYEQPAVTKG